MNIFRKALLFSQTFDTASKHRITIRNLYDERGTPVGSSQITVDRIVLELGSPDVGAAPPMSSTSLSSSTLIQSSNSASPANPGSITSPSVTSGDPHAPSALSSANGTHQLSIGTPSSSNSIPTDFSYNTQPTSGTSTLNGNLVDSSTVPSFSANPSSIPKPPIGPIIGGVLGFVALIAFIALLAYIRLLRRKLNPGAGDSVVKEERGSISRARPYTAARPISLRYGDCSLPPQKGYVSAGGFIDIVPHSDSQTSDLLQCSESPELFLGSVITGDRSSPEVLGVTRREMDLGPLNPHQEEQGRELLVLPPQYGHIFGRRDVSGGLPGSNPGVVYDVP